MDEHERPYRSPYREYAGVYSYMVWIGFEKMPDSQEVERMIEALGGELVEEAVLAGGKAGGTGPRRPAA
jgi:hypothetical protein